QELESILRHDLYISLTADAKVFVSSADDDRIDLHDIHFHRRIVMFEEVDHGAAAQTDDQHLLLLRTEQITEEHVPCVRNNQIMGPVEVHDGLDDRSEE